MILIGINTTCDISKLSQISLALRLMKLRITIISKYHSWCLCQISLQIMLLPILTIINFQSLHAVTCNECKTYLQTWYTKNKNIFIAEKIDFIQKYRVNFPKFKIKNLSLVLFHPLKTLTQTSLKLYMWTLSVSANCCTCEWLGYQYFSWEMNSSLKILSSDEYSRMLVSRNSRLESRFRLLEPRFVWVLRICFTHRGNEIQTLSIRSTN